MSPAHDYQHQIKFTNELSQFMLPWQPKHHTTSDFTKKCHIPGKGPFQNKLSPFSTTEHE